MVDGVKAKQVSIGQVFTYTLKVENTSDVDLTNVVVTDTPEQGIVIVSANGVGIITANTWTHTIANLKARESLSFVLTAKVSDGFDGKSLINKVCVNAPEVNPANPELVDACDTAAVNVPEVLGEVTPPSPQTPTVLHNTGAGSIAGMTAAVAILSAIAHRMVVLRRKITD